MKTGILNININDWGHSFESIPEGYHIRWWQQMNDLNVCKFTNHFLHNYELLFNKHTFGRLKFTIVTVILLVQIHCTFLAGLLVSCFLFPTSYFSVPQAFLLSASTFILCLAQIQWFFCQSSSVAPHCFLNVISLLFKEVPTMDPLCAFLASSPLCC